ncbi:MAG: MATE family efflux transporter [Clostridia bacterium]
MTKTISFTNEKHSALKVILLLAWPAILEQLLISLVQYVDTAMVGSLGTNATGSIALVTPSIWLVNGIFAGIAIGFSVPIGNYIGSNQLDKARNVARQAVIAIGLLGIIVSILMIALAQFLPTLLKGEVAIRADATGYLSIIAAGFIFNITINICSGILRCTGDTKTPLLCNLATNVINVVLNFLFIFSTRQITIFGFEFTMWGAGLGVKGAALATIIALSFSASMLFSKLFRKKFVINIVLKDIRKFDKEVWKDMVRIGSPVAIERATVSVGQIFMTAIVTALGKAALAAHYLSIVAESFTYMPAFGFSVAATTLVSQSLGANKPQLAKKYSRLCIISGMVFMTVMGVVLFFASNFLISLFSQDAEVIALGGKVLKIEALAQPFFACAMAVTGVLRGARDTKWPFYISAIGMWGIRLPLAFILTKYTTLGLTGAWIGMVIDMVLRGVLSYFRFRSNKWNKPIINDLLPDKELTPIDEETTLGV